MERYENSVKIEEMRKLAELNKYEKAMMILETMDTGKIKALTDLSVIAEVYMQNERYEEAMVVLTKVYAKTKTRRVLYQLVDLAIKKGNAQEAEEYLERYIKAAPQDSSRFIFRYCIDKLNSEPYEILIASLEQLKEYEYYEMWAYELAKLFHKAGMIDKCVRECSDIILWFGEGLYVEKAKLLKGYYVGEINPIHMLKAKEKKDAEMKLGLDKTKDYSEMKSQIDRYLEDDGTRNGKAWRQEDNFGSADIKEIKPETKIFNTSSKIWPSTMEKATAERNEEEQIHTWHEQDKEEETRIVEKEWEVTDTANKDAETVWNETDIVIRNTVIRNTDTAIEDTDIVIGDTDTLIEDTDTVIGDTDTAIKDTDTVIEDTDTLIEGIDTRIEETETTGNELKSVSADVAEPVVYDQELEAFFKRVARRLEGEITPGIKTDEEVDTYKEEEPADNRVPKKEEHINYRKIEDENEIFEKEEKQEEIISEAAISEDTVPADTVFEEIEEMVLEEKEETELEEAAEKVLEDKIEMVLKEKDETVPEETVRQVTKVEELKEQGAIAVNPYNAEADIPQEQSDEEESAAGESLLSTDSLNHTNNRKEYTNNSIYLPGKFDSIFSEAGMNYEKNFGYLVRMKSTVKQIEECLEMILSDYTKINHLIITGRRKSGKTTLAKKISKALYGLNWINTNRVAKISALKLNGITLINRKEKLVNSSLIIEEAGKLDISAAEQLLALIDELNGNLFVILEDKEDDINRLLQRSPKLKEIFGSRVKLPDYGKEDLLGFAFTYIQNYDYEFTLDVKKAFAKELEKIIDSVKEEERLEAVMNLTRKAKASADERNKALLSDIIQVRELNSEDFLYVRMEDFLWEDQVNG